jgi:hypothetical protein
MARVGNASCQIERSLFGKSHAEAIFQLGKRFHNAGVLELAHRQHRRTEEAETAHRAESSR